MMIAALAAAVASAEDVAWVFDTSNRPADVTASAEADIETLSAKSRDSLVSSQDLPLDTVCWDIEYSNERGLDTRPPTGLYLIIR